MTVSAVIYSRDEAELLRACLPAVTGFDEVLVCDMQSSDDTVEVAGAAGARVVAVPDARVIEEVRQLGLDNATSDWVLFVDADEILPAGFAEQVRGMITAAGQDGTVGYRLRYSNVAFGRTLRHTLVGSAKFSLMRRDATRFPQPGRAHIPPEFDGPTRDAPATVASILHLNFRGAEQMTEKTMRYAKDSRGDLALLKPTGLARELIRSTIFNGSWRDGYAGAAVSTSLVFGRWYGALLAAEREGTLDSDLPRDEQRRLTAMSRTQATLTRWRDGVRGLLHGRPRSRGRSGR
jgi:hypothetical protein